MKRIGLFFWVLLGYSGVSNIGSRKYGLMIPVVLGGIAILSGCESPGAIFRHEPHEMTIWDAKAVHPLARYSDRHVRLTPEQSRSFNRLYGEEISRAGDLVNYYEARKGKPLYYVAAVFLTHAGGEAGRLNLLVSVSGHVVDEIVIKNNPVIDGQSLVPEAFLEQLIGRSLEDSWGVMPDSSALLALPAGIRPIADYPQASAEIAKAVRRVLVWDRILNH